MGTNPKNSALNKYLQSWDCENLFVVGANAFPHNASYNPTGPVGALAYWTAGRDQEALSEKPGPASVGVMTGLRTVAAVAATLIYAVGVVHAGGDPKHGEKVFEECRACHAIERGVDAVGPDLHGVFGRRAGTLDDFHYSPALKRSGITWTVEALDAYIADPLKVVPANRMPYSGIPDARDRADLIVYTQQVFK